MRTPFKRSKPNGFKIREPTPEGVREKAEDLRCQDRKQRIGSDTMKTITSFLIGLTMTSPLMAVEYVTLHKVGDSKIVSSGSLVEIIGYGRSGDVSASQIVQLTFSDNSVQNLYLSNAVSVGSAGVAAPPHEFKFTGLTKVALYPEAYAFAVTLKITPPQEINAVGPTSVLVIPENSTGDYDIILESSTDMVTWTPIHSQSVSSSNPTNLFRTRIVKKTAP